MVLETARKRDMILVSFLFESLAERDPEMSTKEAEETIFVWFLMLSKTTRQRGMISSSCLF